MNLYLVLLAFLFIYLIYLITVVSFKSKYYIYNNSKQTQYFKKKYNLKFKKISEEEFYNLLALTNSLVIALTFYVTLLIGGLLYKMLLAFITFIPLILIFYSVLGNYIKKKEGK